MGMFKTCNCGLCNLPQGRVEGVSPFVLGEQRVVLFHRNHRILKREADSGVAVEFPVWNTGADGTRRSPTRLKVCDQATTQCPSQDPQPH